MNPILHKLGFAATDRVVVFHADDIGMCQSTLAAYSDLLEFGLLSSAAVMVPCPWFRAAADLIVRCQDHPQVDVGVHLTLTSEWQGYRWGPIATTDAAAGLRDEEGYFYHQAQPVQTGADIAAVAQELRAQIERAQAAGIRITHIDSHMLTLFHPRFLPLYFALGQEYGVPAFMLRPDGLRRLWGSEAIEPGSAVEADLDAAEEAGMPLFDHFFVPSLHHHEARREAVSAALADFPPGLTYFAFHPAVDTPELRAMTPDWRCRVADYHLFTDPAWRQIVQDSGVQVIGMKTLMAK